MKLMKAILVTLALGLGSYVAVGGFLAACSHNPTASVEATPRTSEEGERAYLTRMQKQGKKVEIPYCWTWFGMDGVWHTGCRWTTNPVYGPQ